MTTMDPLVAERFGDVRCLPERRRESTERLITGVLLDAGLHREAANAAAKRLRSELERRGMLTTPGRQR